MFRVAAPLPSSDDIPTYVEMEVRRGDLTFSNSLLQQPASRAEHEQFGRCVRLGEHRIKGEEEKKSTRSVSWSVVLLVAKSYIRA